MKKIVLAGIKKMEMIDAPMPKILKDDDVLLKIDSVGICGSDMHYYNEGKIGDQVIEFPFAVGHECSAVVVDKGKDVKGLEIGQLVAVDPAVSCHECSQCRSGREHTCLHQKFLGCPGQIEGCLAEFIVMSERNCYPVANGITGESAALIEPLSIGWYAAHFIHNKNSVKRVAILGSGPIGLSVLLSLKAGGFKDIYMTDKLDYRLDAALRGGAVFTGNPDKEDIVKKFNDNNGGGFDAVFECCGKQEALDQSIELLRPGGMLLIVGIPETDRVSFDISRIRRKEITIQNVRRQNGAVKPSLKLSESGRWEPEFMITHRFAPEETGKAFEMVAGYKDNVIKAVIKF